MCPHLVAVQGVEEPSLQQIKHLEGGVVGGSDQVVAAVVEGQTVDGASVHCGGNKDTLQVWTVAGTKTHYRCALWGEQRHITGVHCGGNKDTLQVCTVGGTKTHYRCALWGEQRHSSLTRL